MWERLVFMDALDRITAYFTACGEGTARDVASHFTPDAVIYDTNIRPMVGAEAIGGGWVAVRERWGGARWGVDSFVGDWNGAAIEWWMTGTDSFDGDSFTFRGSEHYAFQGELISEIRQYWTFDRERLDTALCGFDRW